MFSREEAFVPYPALLSPLACSEELASLKYGGKWRFSPFTKEKPLRGIIIEGEFFSVGHDFTGDCDRWSLPSLHKPTLSPYHPAQSNEFSGKTSFGGGGGKSVSSGADFSPQIREVRNSPSHLFFAARSKSKNPPPPTLHMNSPFVIAQGRQTDHCPVVRNGEGERAWKKGGGFSFSFSAAVEGEKGTNEVSLRGVRLFSLFLFRLDACILEFSTE